MTNRFASLRDDIDRATSAPEQPAANAARASGSRTGKHLVGGYFSRDLSRDIRRLALDEETTVQALLGEALDLLLRQRGLHPRGER